MASLPSLATLLVRESKAAIYQTALSIANLVGVDTTTWRAGDPTRSLYHLEAELFDVLEENIVGYIQSDFLSLARGMWLKMTAYEKYGVVVPDPTFATTTVILTNAGGGIYDVDANDITFRARTTGKTFHNTSGGHLDNNGATLIVDIEADEAGSASSAAEGDIVEFVTSPFLDGVTCTNPTAAVALDEQDPDTTRDQCRSKLNAISPNGPYDAYRYVARNLELTQASIVPRVRAYGDAGTGRISIYVTGPSGTIAGTDIDLIQAAVLKYCTPLCVTPIVSAAEPVVVPIRYAVWCYRSVKLTAQQIEDAIETSLEQMFAREPIGGDRIDDVGYLYVTRIESAILAAVPGAFRVVIGLPAADVLLTRNQVPALGDVVPSVFFVDDPS